MEDQTAAPTPQAHRVSTTGALVCVTMREGRRTISTMYSASQQTHVSRYYLVTLSSCWVAYSFATPHFVSILLVSAVYNE